MLNLLEKIVYLEGFPQEEGRATTAVKNGMIVRLLTGCGMTKLKDLMLARVVDDTVYRTSINDQPEHELFFGR